MAFGQSINYTGPAYSQDFNGLTNTVSGSYATIPSELSLTPALGTGMTGWFASKVANNNPTYVYGDGTLATQGTVGSYGVAGTNPITDRALGSQAASATSIPRFGVKFINGDAALTYTTATVTFDVEHWRRISQGDDVIQNTFSWAVGTAAGLNIDSGGFTTVSQLAWNRVNLATVNDTAYDGNAAGNKVVGKTFTFNIAWQPGQALVFRWDDQNAAGTDDILAIDNFNFLAGGALLPRNLTWNTANTTGNWNTTAGNNVWLEGANPTNFQNPDIVTFGDTANNIAVTVDAGGVIPVSTTVSNNNAATGYTLSGGSIQGALNKSGAGRLTLSNDNAFNAATVTGGTLETKTSNATGQGALAIGNATWVVNGVAQTKTGSVNLTGPTTIQTDTDLTFLTQGATAQTLTKTGAGMLTVSGGFDTNTAPALNVLAGTLRFSATGGTGAVSAAQIVNINQGATVDESFGNGEGLGGISDGPAGGGTWIGRAAQTLTMDTNTSLTFSGRFTAGTNGVIGATAADRQMNVVKNGTGTLTLPGNTSDYAGFTRIQNGVVAIDSINNRGNASPLGFGNGTNGADIAIGTGTTAAAVLRYGGATVSTDRTASLLGTGTATNGIEVTTLGTSLTMTGLVDGAGALTKSGPGTLALTAANTYVAGTSVTAGRFLANNATGSATGPGAVTVTNAAIVGGRGSIAGNVSLLSTAHLAPGDGTGSLDIGGTLSLASTGALDIEVGGGLPGDGAGTYDQVLVAGTATFNGATLNLTAVGSPGLLGNEALYILARTGGPTTDTFNNLAEGATVTLGSFTGTITYQANWTGTLAGSSTTGGDDVAIIGNSVPEPGTLTLLGLAAAPMLMRRRRRA